MADAQGGTGSPAIVDQSVGELNSKLSEVVDNALGFGCLEGQIKGKLVKLRDPVPFCDYLSHDATFDSVESTSSSKDAVRLKQMVQLAGIEGDYGVESGFSSFIQTFRDQRVVFFFFRRVIAKRSIPVPKFSTLIPVRQGAHLEDGRWIVEQFGNQVCTDEFYGGLANVAFSWDHSARMTASKLISGVQAAMAKGDLKKEFLQMCKTNQINCRANVKGFSLPFTIEGTLTTTSGVMNLIESLNQLPIKCAVPVGTSSVRIQFTGGFPPTIYVETKIRDIKTQEKLMALLQRLRGTERDIPALCELVERLGEEIENAEFNDRAVLHDLRELASSVAQTLIHHGKRVELYERYGEHRLHTENCDSNGVTSSATETLFTLTLGVAIPVVRSYQREWFNNAEKWTPPEHYKTTQIGSTNAVSGYYDRVKLQLLFNDEELAALTIAEIKAETERIQMEIAAHCDAEIELIHAEKAALDVKLRATADEIEASARAKVSEIIAQAEGLAAKKMEKFRARKLRMQQLEMLDALATNPKTVVSGETSNSLLSEMLVANRQGNVLVNLDGAAVKGVKSGGGVA